MSRIEQIKEYIKKQTMTPTIKEDDLLFTNGLIDSFGVLELIAHLEDTFKNV